MSPYLWPFQAAIPAYLFFAAPRGFPFREPVAFASHSLLTRLACGATAGGDEQNRTVDPLLARQVLSQLSYAPISSQSASPPSVPHSLLQKMVGPSGLEPPTSRLSVVRSSQLSYGPIFGLSPSSLEYALSTL